MLTNIFTTITNEYLKAKTQQLANHPLAYYIRHDAPKIIASNISLTSKNYILKGSTGQGNWATIPWIALFDKEITQGAQQGHYIVYLFKSDMKGFYLSLNQGWTFYKKTYQENAKKEIEKDAARWKKELLPSISNFNFTTNRIDLTSKNELAIGYELGHICGKYYTPSQLNEEELLSDLKSLINIYSELKHKMKN